MSFAWPLLLWLLLVPAALLAWDITHRRRAAVTARPKILRAEAGVRSLKLSSFASGAGTAMARPRWWLWAGLTCGVVALARPQWGRLEEPVFEQSREVLLAIDLSRSMLAEDVRPSRLDRAKLLIRSLLEKLAGERIGLVVFSGTAFLQSPLSSDYEILLEFLPSLGPDYLPEGGSNYRAMIDTSLAAFASTANADRYLLVLSDGEATDDDWKARIPELKTKGIRVIGLGVGTGTGGMIPDPTGGFVKDDRGAVVLTKLESGTLQELTRDTGGTYRDASSWVDLAALLKETIEAGRQGQFVETNTIRLVERFQWPLAFGLWCLLVSFCYEFPVRPRPRAIVRPGIPLPPVIAPPKPNHPATTSTVAALALLLALAPSAPRAQAATVPAPTAADLAKTPNPEAPPPPALVTMVGRLSNAPTHSARDWAELARETVSWGSKIQEERQAVPEGPVNDALSAVELGARLDTRTADWPKLKKELKALLQKPPEEQNDQNQNQPDQNEKMDQKQQKKEKQDSSKSEKDQKQSEDQQQKKEPQSQEENGPKPEDPAKDPGEAAFGDMKQKQEPPPPPPPSDTQKVGGADKAEETQEATDPSLALPLQKLDQLRNQDSPAQLFQMMDGPRKAPKKPAKDW